MQKRITSDTGRRIYVVTASKQPNPESQNREHFTLFVLARDMRDVLDCLTLRRPEIEVHVINQGGEIDYEIEYGDRQIEPDGVVIPMEGRR